MEKFETNNRKFANTLTTDGSFFLCSSQLPLMNFINFSTMLQMEGICHLCQDTSGVGFDPDVNASPTQHQGHIYLHT